MAVWDQLKEVLNELRGREPNPVGPIGKLDEGHSPPYEVWLAPWAESVAEMLDQQFGDDVRIKLRTIAGLGEPRSRKC